MGEQIDGRFQFGNETCLVEANSAVATAHKYRVEHYSTHLPYVPMPDLYGDEQERWIIIMVPPLRGGYCRA